MGLRRKADAGKARSNHALAGWKLTLVILGGMLVVLVAAALAFLYQPAYAVDPAARAFINEQVARQEKIQAGLLEYYNAGEYKFEDPMVIQNPYQTAPLTALVVFDTQAESRISIHVPGKTSQADVDYTFPGFRRHHEIPVLGLYSDMLNRVTISLEMADGEQRRKVIELQTEPLPVDMQSFVVEKVEVEKYNPGFNFTFSSQKPVFDINGEVRWYSTRLSFFAFTRLQNGHFLFIYPLDDEETKSAMETDLLGRIYKIFYFPGNIHHDVIELPSGNLLATTSEIESDTVEDIVVEIDRDTGHIVHYLDFKRVLDRYQPQIVDGVGADWLHLNSIAFTPGDQSILISSRGQSAVIKLSYPDISIQWILGPHTLWGKNYQPYLLTPVGEVFEWQWGQHHASLLDPPGTSEPGIVDILVFDNGRYRDFDHDFPPQAEEWYTRVVIYRVNEEARTVEQVWEYGKERGSAIFSANLGSAYILPNGNMLGTWGAIVKDSQGIPGINHGDDNTIATRLIEIDPADDQVVFEVYAKGFESYRAFRGGLYDGFSQDASSMRSPLKDTSRNDLVDRLWMGWEDLKHWSNEVPVLLQVKRFLRRLF